MPKTIREMDQLVSSTQTDNPIQTNSNASVSDLLISTQTRSSSKTTIVKQINKVYSCDQCNNFCTVSKVEFNRHVKSHKPQEEKITYQCEHCDKSFKGLMQLNNHRNIHFGSKPYECDKCDQSFTTNGELLRHNRYKHTLEKPHKCTECEYSTVELSKLKRHMRIHTDERPYLCGFCDYASRDTFKLKRHIRTHTGEKPYECPICNAKFTQSNSLKLHLKLHTQEDENNSNEKDENEKTTNSKKSRKRAVKNENFILDDDSTLDSSVINKRSKPSGDIHSSNEDIKLSTSIRKSNEKPVRDDDDLWFTCDNCFMRFLTKELLDEHYVKHTGERPFECEICGIRFGQKFSLKAHQMSHDADYRENLKKALQSASQMIQKSLTKKKDDVDEKTNL